MRRVDVLDITYQQLFEQATVCEAMLVALLHMQVNVCMFEGRQVSRTGITRFRKNIICFPQHVSDLQQHIDFTNSVAVNDILNIRRYPHLPVTDVRSSEVIRARVTAIRPTGFQVSVPGETDERLVPPQDVQARVTLPWKPTDLRHALIVLRRRDNNKDFYVDDLRVRRNYVIALLRCLSELGHWRENCGEEPMHMYYTEFDWLPDNEIESVLPEDGLPEGLHIEDYDDTPAAASFTKTEFHDWIWEGRHDCDIAFSLL